VSNRSLILSIAAPTTLCPTIYQPLYEKATQKGCVLIAPAPHPRLTHRACMVQQQPISFFSSRFPPLTTAIPKTVAHISHIKTHAHTHPSSSKATPPGFSSPFCLSTDGESTRNPLASKAGGINLQSPCLPLWEGERPLSTRPARFVKGLAHPPPRVERYILPHTRPSGACRAACIPTLCLCCSHTQHT
jgi:hypothetical protein